jgi:hypothetical protein
MCQVIALLAHRPPYLNRAVDPASADKIPPVATRRLVRPCRGWENPLPHLGKAFSAACAPIAVCLVDVLTAVGARVVGRPIVAPWHCCPKLSPENKWFIQAANPSQAGSRHLAEKALTATLLSAEGAASAIDPLEGLGALFARIWLFLTWHVRPVHELESDPGLAATLH